MKDRILILGIGNSGRADDGLGWKFLEAIPTDLPNMDVEHRFQLQIEDAHLINEYSTVIFVDASREPYPEGFLLSPCEPVAMQNSFTTHKLEPSSVLWLCRELYGYAPRANVLAISGSTWDLHEGLSLQAELNLRKAISFFQTSANWKWLVGARKTTEIACTATQAYPPQSGTGVPGSKSSSI
jgi:hydrogenase maturation protease